jgi:hypothetical protein
MVHVCNSSYLGSRDKRITKLKPALVELARLFSKNKIQTKGLGVWLKHKIALHV